LCCGSSSAQALRALEMRERVSEEDILRFAQNDENRQISLVREMAQSAKRFYDEGSLAVNDGKSSHPTSYINLSFSSFI